MKIAIIGAGFSGMALAWNLIHQDGIEITLFDFNGIGGGASGVAAGLLHPFAGLHSKLNWKGREGMQATQILLESVGPTVYDHSGLIRMALTEENIKDYTLCAQRYPEDVAWLEADQLSTLAPQTTHRPGLYIKNALTVYSKLYLDHLWMICSKQHCTLEKTEIKSLDEVKDFDAIVVANGASVCKINELSDLPITVVKGQILELSWPVHLPPLSIPLNSQAYIMMTPSNQTCLVGATFERNSINYNLDYAKQDLLPKAIAMIPDLKNSSVVSSRLGYRASTQDHKPFMKKISSKCWVLSGMGSKGLLYHALYAEMLAKEIISSKLC